MRSITPLANRSHYAFEAGLDEYGSVSSGRDNGFVWRTFTDASFHFRTGPTRQGHFAPLVRVTSSSLAFSLRELEIELYTLTQPSGYAIRRDTRRVDTCQRFEAKAIENTDSFSQINLIAMQIGNNLIFISSGFFFTCCLIIDVKNSNIITKNTHTTCSSNGIFAKN